MRGAAPCVFSGRLAFRFKPIRARLPVWLLIDRRDSLQEAPYRSSTWMGLKAVGYVNPYIFGTPVLRQTLDIAPVWLTLDKPAKFDAYRSQYERLELSSRLAYRRVLPVLLADEKEAAVILKVAWQLQRC